MSKRRDIEVFSLSFMDCICCGFGAIILLFVLTIGPVKQETQQREQAVESVLDLLKIRLDTLKNEASSLQALLEATVQATPDSVDEGASLEKLTQLEQQITQARQKLEKLTRQQQDIEDQMTADADDSDVTTSPVGVPTDSDYLVFIIDTSGSMRNILGQMNGQVIEQLRHTLNAYPEVKAFQVLDCSGQYLFEGTRKEWITDSSRNRAQILQNLLIYEKTSASNPIPGLVQFFKDFKPAGTPDKKIGVYIFGDEFTDTAASVLERMDKLNPRSELTGKRVVSISAVGFPFRLRNDPQPSHTSYKFAHLMRELTREHDGAFMVLGNR